ncbi:FG-GAP-like repeat-containing protein [Streptomyces purpureus]|uniref:FG-GAP-like repeat-containing protein n=1 Tax=Streptomyces purpureus TaxID=1951 RepID=UPI0037B89F31
MRRHALVRSAVAAATVVGITAGLAPLTSGQAFAAEVPPGTLTIPSEQTPDPNTTVLQSSGAGESGFLAGWADSGFRWTSYADGTSRPVVLPEGVKAPWGTYTDWIVLPEGRKVVQRHMKTGEERTFALPVEQDFYTAFGDVVVTEERSGAEVAAIHLLTWKDGQVQDQRIRMEADFVSVLAGDKDGLLLTVRYGDLTLVEHLTPGNARRGTQLDDVAYRTEMGGGRVTQWYEDGRVKVWNVTDLQKPLHELTIPQTNRAQLLGTVGDQVLVARRISTGDEVVQYSALAWRVVAVPVGGGAEKVLFERATAMPTFKADGTLLIGRADTGEGTGQGVYAVRPGTGGGLDVTKVADAPLIRTAVTGLALDHGRLSTVERVPTDGGTANRLRSVDLTAAGPLKAGKRTDRFAVAPDAEVRSSSEGWFLRDKQGQLTHFANDGTSRWTKPVYFRDAAKDDVRVSGRHVAAWHRYDLTPEVFDAPTGEELFSQGTETPFALDGSTLWTKADGLGSVSSRDVRTGKSGGTVKIADCGLNDIQALGTALYWDCGAEGSGVYDTVTKKSVTLPKHEGALLGDGYVAWQKDGVLSTTDVRGTTGTRKIGTPRVAAKGQGWTVDRSGGAVAYADAEDAVHVVPSGVPASPLTSADAEVPATANVKTGAWAPRWWLSKPAASWQLTLKHAVTGKTVRTLTGGETRGALGASWDGKDAAGRFAADGAYTWALTARPADGQGAELTASGRMQLRGAAPVARDYAGTGSLPDAVPDLLALSGTGSLDFWHGTAAGGVSGKTAGAGWPAGVTAVPVGDMNGDRCNDVLVRMPGGELRTYKPGCGKALTPTAPYTKAGTGFAGFDVLTAPGDLSGDGMTDLVGRKNGDLYLFTARTNGTVASGVEIGTGWGGFSHIVGVGDLNGDGLGDLIGRKTTGVTYRYDGRKNGVKTAVKIFSRWGGSYNAIVGAGDLTADGKPDLVARDTSGRLHRMSGDGKGSFGAAVQIGSGFGSMKGVF